MDTLSPIGDFVAFDVSENAAPRYRSTKREDYYSSGLYTIMTQWLLPVSARGSSCIMIPPLRPIFPPLHLPPTAGRLLLDR